MKRFKALLLTLIMGISVTGCNISSNVGHGNTVLATAGDATIYLRDMMYVLGTYKANYVQMLMQFGYTYEELDEYWQTEIEEGYTMEEDIISISLEQAKEDAALLLLAENAGFSYSKEDINDLKSQLKSYVTSLGTKEKIGERVFFETYLVSQDEYIQGEQHMSTINNYKQSIRESVEVTEDEIREYYEENVDNIRDIVVQHVLIKYNDSEEEDNEPTDEEKAAALARAEDVLAQAQAGADFGQLAAEYSEDDGSKDENGEYTVNARSQFVEEFMDWAFEAGEGDMGIIETEYGYHVMKYISTSTYEELVETIISTLQNNRMNLLIQQYIEELELEWEVDEELLASISIVV